jgi:hypothetical protein
MAGEQSLSGTECGDDLLVCHGGLFYALTGEVQARCTLSPEENRPELSHLRPARF